ncbi:MAG: hypothetical protein QXX68_03220 [Candidatus Pacearchaeota archaeon]
MSKRFKNFLKESARDTLSLGSVAFLVLFFARALVGSHNEIVLELVFSSLILLIFSFFIKNFEYHLSLGFILMVFTIIFYNFKPYKIFSIIVYLLMILSAYYLGFSKKEIFKGILLGVLSTVFGYFLTLLFF